VESGREEEIDEGQDSAGKAGKAGTKVKRLKPLVDLEEEDLDDNELGHDSIQVSLSIARPPNKRQAVLAILTCRSRNSRCQS